MTPSSQEMESPENPERFILLSTASLGQSSKAGRVGEKKGDKMIDYGTSPPISLSSSDLGIALWEGKIKGELQLANSRILVIDHHDQQVTAFDLTGTLIGNASFLEDERKGTWELEPEQHTAKTRAQILNERVFGVPPVSWTPNPLGEWRTRCQEQDELIHPSFASR